MSNHNSRTHVTNLWPLTGWSVPLSIYLSPFTYTLQQVLTYNTGIGEESMAIQGELSLLCIDFHGSQIVLSPNPTLLSNRNPVDS